mmetsp:Transcript_4135/g.12428  ORF Transcript_4135/g.12428 Transcript_4135/m.12428 type:complete len:659 (-) Transcript_4135:1916-3892(-)
MGASISRYVFRVRDPTYMDDEGFMMYIKRAYNERGGTTGKTKIVWLTTKRKSKIPSVMLQCRQRPPKYTLLLSHGNMEDLGIAASDASAYCDELGCDIFIYEYTGFGISQGRPSELDCYADIVAAYDYLFHEAQIPSEKIVLFGRSMGSGPSVFLARHRKVGGMILVAPFLSCARVVQNFKVTPPFDIFSNIDRIGKVDCEILFIHGRKDQVVPVEHSTELARKAPNVAIPLWIEKAGHNNVEKDFQTVVVPRLKSFLSELVPPPPRPREFPENSSALSNRALSKLNFLSETFRESRSSFDMFRDDDDDDVSTSSRTNTNRGKSVVEPRSFVLGSDPRVPSEEEAEYAVRSSLDLKSNSVLRSGPNNRPSREVYRNNDDPELWKKKPLASTWVGGARNRRGFPSAEMEIEQFSTERPPATMKKLQLMRTKLPGGEIARSADEYLLRFLQARKFDVTAAVDLFFQFENVCGGLAINPQASIPLAHVQRALAKNILYLTGAVDAKGAPVIFIRVANFRPTETTWKEIVRLLLFYQNVIFESNDVSRKGIAFVVDLKYYSNVNFSTDRARQFLHLIQKAYPAKVQSFVVVDAPLLLVKQWFKVRPLIKSELARVMVTRCPRSNLGEEYGRDVLPDFLGGRLDSTSPLALVDVARKRFAERS